MSSQPDLTVKEAVAETKVLAAEAPKAISAARSDIFAIEREIVKAFPHTPLSDQVTKLADGVSGGFLQADEAAVGISKLIAQLGIPLTMVGGVRLQGTGAVVGAVTNAEGKLMQGVRFALTHKQQIVSDVAGALTLLAVAGGFFLQLFPQFKDAAFDGVSLAAAIQGLKSVIIPRLNQYADAAPRAELVNTK